MKLTNLFKPGSWTKAMFGTFAAALFFINTSSAQSCLVNSLIINSGYDNATNTVIPLETNDPNWILTGGSALFFANTPAVINNPAYALTPWTGWSALDPNSRWISFGPEGIGYVAPLPLTNVFEMELTRRFSTCIEDDITFNISIARDNYIRDILVDGNPAGIFSEAPNNVGTNFTLFATGSATISLPAGPHEITVIVGNYPYGTINDDNNGHAVNIVGTITGTINSIVGPDCPKGYSCEPLKTCEDECFWKVQGNNIIGANNIFGTLTNNDVRIKTNGTDRGILDKTGLFGWNTMSPTAYLHVNCNGHNLANGLSDVRFEKLERGKGNILVIDQQGYVYDSGIKIEDLLHHAAVGEEKAGNGDLQQEVEALKQQVQTLMAEKRQAGGAMNSTDNLLYQNNPNPFSNETEIVYEIKTMRSKAAINIYDLNGKQLKSYPINATGKGKVVVNKEALSAGVYMYSLVVDGVENATKKMILTN